MFGIDRRIWPIWHRYADALTNVCVAVLIPMTCHSQVLIGQSWVLIETLSNGVSFSFCCLARNSYSPFTRYNRLSNQLSDGFDNWLYRVYKHSTGCQTCLTTGCIVYTASCQSGFTTQFDNQLNEQWLFVQHGCQTVNQLDVCLYDTAVVKPVVEPV